jgi:dUTPase
MSNFHKNFIDANLINRCKNNLLGYYDRYMHLKLFVDGNDNELKNMYLAAAHNHNTKILNNLQMVDAGFDLFAPGNEGKELDIYGNSLRFFGPGWSDANPVNKLDFKICCSAQMVTEKKVFNTGYYTYPRSSLSKTQLRLANCTGIIDAGYRGHIIGMFDVVNIQNADSNKESDYFGEKFDRYIQICAPGLVPIVVEIVDTKEELGVPTERGEGGFGSTGR